MNMSKKAKKSNSAGLGIHTFLLSANLYLNGGYKGCEHLVSNVIFVVSLIFSFSRKRVAIVFWKTSASSWIIH